MWIISLSLEILANLILKEGKSSHRQNARYASDNPCVWAVFIKTTQFEEEVTNLNHNIHLKNLVEKKQQLTLKF